MFLSFILKDMFIAWSEKLKTLNHKIVDLCVSKVFVLEFVHGTAYQEQIMLRSYNVTRMVTFTSEVYSF